MAKHIVQTYDEELSELHRLIAQMENDVCAALQVACNELIKGEKQHTVEIIEQDKLINAQEQKINRKAQNILALRAPMANDLRLVLTSLQVASNLERVGDLAKNIAKINNKIEARFPEDIADSLKQMSEMALANLRDSIVAYNNKDEVSAQNVFDADVSLDRHHKSLSRDIIKRLRTKEDHFETLVQLLFVTRHLERVGDHAKNIAEATIYMSTGEMNRFDLLEDTQDS